MKQRNNIQLICKICGTPFCVPIWRANTAKYCSVACQHKSLHAAPNLQCPICGKYFHTKASHAKKYKTVCCSKECGLVMKAMQMTGENNHQYGLKGSKNASFKPGALNKRNNNNNDVYIYVQGHPKAKRNGRVLVHRYIVEMNHERYDSKYFERIGDWVVLKDNIHVHHINGNHDDNRVENLIPLTKSEHKSIHNKENISLREHKTGRISTTFKKSDFLPIEIVKGSPIPVKATKGSAGADLMSAEHYVIAPGERVLIKTDVSVAIPEGCAGFVMGRSGNTIKRGINVALGLIDSDYRGTLGVMAFNQSQEEVIINKGDRIAQLFVIPIPHIKFIEVDTLSDSDRGAGGYGSTGN